jgi:hypothetical protein
MKTERVREREIKTELITANEGMNGLPRYYVWTNRDHGILQ